jgi:hypothetical protein
MHDVTGKCSVACQHKNTVLILKNKCNWHVYRKKRVNILGFTGKQQVHTLTFHCLKGRGLTTEAVCNLILKIVNKNHVTSITVT